MTGQVKEEILTRFGELGVTVEDGRVSFRPRLLARDEFLAAPAVFRLPEHDGSEREFALPAGALAFTFARTPVVYTLTDGEPWVRVVGADGIERHRLGDTLSAAESRSLLARDRTLARIEVGVPARSPAGR